MSKTSEFVKNEIVKIISAAKERKSLAESKSNKLVKLIQEEIESVMHEERKNRESIGKKLEEMRKNLAKEKPFKESMSTTQRTYAKWPTERRVPLETVSRLIDVPMNELLLFFLNGHRIKEGEALIEYHLGTVCFYTGDENKQDVEVPITEAKKVSEGHKDPQAAQRRSAQDREQGAQRKAAVTSKSGWNKGWGLTSKSKKTRKKLDPGYHGGEDEPEKSTTGWKKRMTGKAEATIQPAIKIKDEPAKTKNPVQKMKALPEAELKTIPPKKTQRIKNEDAFQGTRAKDKPGTTDTMDYSIPGKYTHRSKKITDPEAYKKDLFKKKDKKENVLLSKLVPEIVKAKECSDTDMKKKEK